MLTRRQFTLTAGLGLLAAPAILSGRARATEAKTLRIGWQKNGVLALAKSQGALEARFADAGLAVTWSEFSSGPPLLEALGAGALDFGATAEAPPPSPRRRGESPRSRTCLPASTSRPRA